MAYSNDESAASPPAPAADSTAEVSWIDHATFTELQHVSTEVTWLPEPTAQELAWLANLRRRLGRRAT